ncbi:uncharacterized protein LOC129589721 [Paramacrobiotus metropolitanus]|uniref:uncharacterized protein LOC129589721 n=1 Tax=Paramacrobiotus metropolitanus TaxID=2943436 RepID=UPI00244653E3|nr:uncharacterized protein LOC129589721 [Paramacrobiotus metropolitanus]
MASSTTPRPVDGFYFEMEFIFDQHEAHGFKPTKALTDLMRQHNMKGDYYDCNMMVASHKMHFILFGHRSQEKVEAFKKPLKEHLDMRAAGKHRLDELLPSKGHTEKYMDWDKDKVNDICRYSAERMREISAECKKMEEEPAGPNGPPVWIARVEGGVSERELDFDWRTGTTPPLLPNSSQNRLKGELYDLHKTE